MAWFGPAGNCGCCSSCDDTDCGDETFQNINRVTLELSMPDEIVLISQFGTSPNGRRLARFSGWETINGTYTYERDPITCRWDTDILPDTSGVYLESWLLPQTTNCSNIDAKIAEAIILGQSPYHDGYMLSNCVRLIMFTFDIDTKFKHEFALNIQGPVECGGLIAIQLWPDDEVGNVCGESSIVFNEVTNMQRLPGTGTGLVDFDCGGLSGITGIANSYVS